MTPILRKIRAISVSRTARVFVDGGASIGISVIFGLSYLPDGYRFKRPVYRPPIIMASAERPRSRPAPIRSHAPRGRADRRRRRTARSARPRRRAGQIMRGGNRNRPIIAPEKFASSPPSIAAEYAGGV